MLSVSIFQNTLFIFKFFKHHGISKIVQASNVKGLSIIIETSRIVFVLLLFATYIRSYLDYKNRLHQVFSCVAKNRKMSI